MLKHPTLDKLNDMRLVGMAHAFASQLDDDHIHQLDFEEHFGLLVDAEHLNRTNRRLKTRLRQAKLRQSATMGPFPQKYQRSHRNLARPLNQFR